MPAALGELPPAYARVDCSGGRHSLRWHAGELVALDHDDPEGERALAALGATSCACLDVLGAWSRQRENPGLLTALSRGTQDVVHVEGFGTLSFPPNSGVTMVMPGNTVLPSSVRNRPPGRWAAVTGTQVGMGSSAVVTGVTGLPGDAGPTYERDVALLAGLGYDLTLRFVATVTAVLLARSDGIDRSSARPSLEASLLGRVSCALRAWLSTPHVDVDLQMTERQEDTSLVWDGSGPVQVTLPPEWVMTVWGRDLTVIAGRFSLGVLDSTDTRTTLLTVGSDLGTPRPLVVELL
jgi:hypothetical protein